MYLPHNDLVLTTYDCFNASTFLSVKGGRKDKEEAPMEWSTLEGTHGKTLCSIHRKRGLTYGLER